MNIELLKSLIIDQHNQTRLENIIEREIYQEIISWQNNQQIIIIMGVRRCGKSTLLQHLRRNSEESDYYVNFDDDRLAEFQLKDFQSLLEALLELFGEQKTFYFDEIQNIPEWERFVRRLHDMGNKIYITGSNAIMLSQELGTRLTGRYLPIKMYPFSFNEFIKYKMPDFLPNNLGTKETV